MRWPAFQTLELESAGAVTWLRLNRPARLNALTEESFGDLAAAWRAVAADAETRVLVLTGKGRGFCAGSDVDGLQERTGWSAVRQRTRFDRLGRDVVLGLYNLGLPTIACINGPVSGGGLSLALACDIRMASEEAVFAFGWTGVGLVPDLGATYFLPRVIGLSQAYRLLWTNARRSASEALALGLVDEILAPDVLAERVAALAAQIAAAPQLAVRLGRTALRAASHATLAEALETEAAVQSLCLQSADHRDTVQAFRRRRGGDARSGVASNVQ